MTALSPQSSVLSPDASSGLVINNVTKEYPTPAEPLVVLRGVSFSLSPGDRLAIVGPSGSGKSTLLNILGTLDAPSAGTVTLNGVDPFSLSAKELAKFRGSRVGFVFQDHHLLPQCNALENVLIARLASGGVKKSDADRAAELLQQVGLRDRASHLPAELSGGERQRVAIARALMNSPQLVLCDEPTGNLDTHTGQVIGELLTRLAAQSQAILVAVTHSAALAEMFPRKMGMVDGKLT
jgi:lipoprotein-releasing system ATP-binding protein